MESERIFGIDVERALQDRLVLLEPSFKIGYKVPGTPYTATALL